MSLTSSHPRKKTTPRFFVLLFPLLLILPFLNFDPTLPTPAIPSIDFNFQESYVFDDASTFDSEDKTTWYLIKNMIRHEALMRILHENTPDKYFVWSFHGEPETSNTSRNSNIEISFDDRNLVDFDAVHITSFTFFYVTESNLDKNLPFEPIMFPFV